MPKQWLAGLQQILPTTGIKQKILTTKKPTSLQQADTGCPAFFFGGRHAERPRLES